MFTHHRWRFLRHGRSELALILLLTLVLTSLVEPPPALAISIIEYPLPSPDAQASCITAGPDGNVWFVEYYSPLVSKIGRITPEGVVTEFALPTPDVGIGGISAGPDGKIWFTEGNNKIGRLDPATGAITEYPIPTKNLWIGRITSGPDANLWFTELGPGYNSRIGKITTGGVITEFVIPEILFPFDITTGPDRNLWFTDEWGFWIGKVTPTGAFTFYPVKKPTGMGLEAITAGPDGNVWFTGLEPSKIGRITPSGEITLMDLPGTGNGSTGLTTGPDGNLWFTQYFGHKIGRLTTSGSFTEYEVNGSTYDITTGPDGNLWFTFSYPAGKLGKIVFPPKAKVLPADLAGQLRVTPDRIANTSPETLISFNFTLNNLGPGRASVPRLIFPLDPNLVVGYATFSDTRMWVSEIVTGGDSPYLKVELPPIEPNQVLQGTLVFRPGSNVTSGTNVTLRYQLRWDDDQSPGKMVSSNAVHLTLSADSPSQNESAGEVQKFEPPQINAQAGTQIQVKGDFYAPNELVSFWFTDSDSNSVAIGTLQADQNGTVNFEYTLPSWQTGQTYVIAGQGGRSRITGSVVIFVTGPQ